MRIEAFEWDDRNEDYATGRITADEIDSVLESAILIVRNKNARAGTHKIIGVTYAGQVVTVIVAPTARPRTWRPINAWPADAEELTHARKAGIIK